MGGGGGGGGERGPCFGACEKSSVKFMDRLLEHFVGFGAMSMRLKN